VPNGALSIQEIAPHQIRSRHILMASNRYQRTLKKEGHVLYESGLAGPGRTLEHDRHTLSVSRLEKPDFIAYGAVVWLFPDPKLVQLHPVRTYAISALAFPRSEAGKGQELRHGVSAMGRNLLVRNAFDRTLFRADGRPREGFHHRAGTFGVGDPLLVEVIRTNCLSANILA